jgi:hypothetical protein
MTGVMPCSDGCRDSSRNLFVGLVVERAALRVADDHVLALECLEERGRDLTGVGAGSVGRDILPAELDRQAVGRHQSLHRAEVGERREDRHLDLGEVVAGVLQAPGEASARRRSTAGGRGSSSSCRRSAARGHRSPWSCLPTEYLQSGKALALEELEAGTSTRRNVAELAVSESQCAHCRRGVAAADDREPSTSVSALPQPSCRRECVELEDAHRSVPEDGADERMASANRAAVSRPDVESDAVTRATVWTRTSRRGDGMLGVRTEL